MSGHSAQGENDLRPWDTKYMTTTLRKLKLMGLAACLIAVLTALSPPEAPAAPAVAAEEMQHQIYRIWPSKPPSPEGWPIKEISRENRTPDGSMQLEYADVSDPTITVVKPAKEKANGQGVIILPGGAFMALAWDKEGMEPARWLAGLGYTAFVLKYRVRQLPFPSDEELGPQPGAFDKAMHFLEPNVRIAVADARQAIGYVRSRARHFGVRPNQVGMMGFSAGATTAMNVSLEADGEFRPDFVAAIYGAMENRPVPLGAPPAFIVAAQDDDIVPVERGLAIFTEWQKAGRSAELHVYQRGGHGFGLGRPGSEVAAWPDSFVRWVEALRRDGD